MSQIEPSTDGEPMRMIAQQSSKHLNAQIVMLLSVILLLISSIVLPIWSYSNYGSGIIQPKGHLDASVFGLAGIGDVPYYFSETALFIPLGDLISGMQTTLQILLLLTATIIASLSAVILNLVRRRNGRESKIPRRLLLLASVAPVMAPVFITFNWSLVMSDYLTPGAPLEFFGTAKGDGWTASFGGGLGWFFMVIAAMTLVLVTVILLRSEDRLRWKRGVITMPIGIGLLAVGFAYKASPRYLVL